MPVRFDAAHVSERFYPIVIPDVGKKYYVRIGTDTTLHRTTDLHFVSKLGRCVPCLHEDCPHCPMSTRATTYVPAMILTAPASLYKPSILPITDAARDLLSQDFAKWVFEVRRKSGKNSPIMWSCHMEMASDVALFPGFDITPSLFRAWGIKQRPAAGEDGL